MTSHLLRRASTLVLALGAAVLALVLTAGPALATEGSESSAEGFGSGQWDGMVLALVGGVLLGIVVFAMSKPGEIKRDSDH